MRTTSEMWGPSRHSSVKTNSTFRTTDPCLVYCRNAGRPCQLAKNVWSAAAVQKNRFRREQSAKMYPASEWRVISGRMMIRACLSSLIPTVVKDLVTPQVLRHAVGLCLRLLFFCRLLRSECQRPLRLVGNGKCSVPGVIVVAAGQNCPTDSGQFVGGGDDYHVAGGSGFQSAHPLSQTRSFALDT